MSNAPRSVAARRHWGDSEEGCAVLHLDMDAFFAAVEVHRRPELRGLPVIVGGGERGVVLSATYEARAFGVRSAMPMAQAVRACPQGIVVNPDMKAYRAASRAVMDILHSVTPQVEQVSVDEAYLDVAGVLKLHGGAVKIAENLRHQINEQLGLTCSVGVSTNKLVAKMASTTIKPDGLLLVPASAVAEFVASLPLRAIPGVGPHTNQRLADWGITTVAQLRDTDLSDLTRIVGQRSAVRLRLNALGKDGRQVDPHTVEKSVSAERTYAADTADRMTQTTTINQLAHECARRLRQGGFKGQTVSLKIKFADFRVVQRSRTVPHYLDTSTDIARIAVELLKEAVSSGDLVRLVGVRVSSLVDNERAFEQPSLFDSEADGVGNPKSARAQHLVDQVTAKYGAKALRSGSATPKPEP